MEVPQTLWTPDPQFIATTQIGHFTQWLHEERHYSFASYQDMWAWSVKNIPTFWDIIWKYYQVQSGTKHEAALFRPSAGMIGTEWFKGSTLNYTEHVFRQAHDLHPAVIFKSEMGIEQTISWQELQAAVAKVATFLRSVGIQQGDRVVAYMPNIPQTLIAFLATQSLGAIWSSCSPDFGADSVIERFQQIEPKLLFAADGYPYNGKTHDKKAVVAQIIDALPTLAHFVPVSYLSPKEFSIGKIAATPWKEIMELNPEKLTYTRVPFQHPIWVLYSSGTTGKPKAITHSVGGILLEHLKALGLHQNCQPGDRFFWYSTTGWMMWNYANSALLHGSTVVLYDGAATYPDRKALWNMAQETEITHFGAGASYFIHCMKSGVSFNPSEFPQLQSIGSTGSPLPVAAFEWIYQHVKQDVWLISLSGGTDICSGFVGGCPSLPVYAGEIQCRMLGCAVYAYNENGQAVTHQLGEMVITEPMPAMPIYFWNDPEHTRYKASYFEVYPDIWRHGDWIQLTERNTLIIYGRSDATLNRKGVRIGTSEIYRIVDQLPQIKDSLIVNIELSDGNDFMPLFVVIQENETLDDTLIWLIKKSLKEQGSPRHIPDEIVEIDSVPYTISGKKMETPVKQILSGKDTSNTISKDAMSNPSSLDFFKAYAQQLINR